MHELHVTNVSNRDFLISRVDVLAGQTTVAAYEGAELNSLMLARQGAQDRRIVAAGGRSDRVFLHPGRARRASGSGRSPRDDRRTERDGAPVSVSTQKPIVIAPPLRGDGWRAGNGPGRDSGHRRALIAVEGAARIAQRFAIDWVRIGDDGRHVHRRRQKTIEAISRTAWTCLPSPTRSWRRSRTAFRRTCRDRRHARCRSRSRPIGGNHVVLDLGGGRFAFYAHLQPGSLRVKAGERVKAGQVLGLVGNSGNSTEPHLHFHISNGDLAAGIRRTPVRDRRQDRHAPSELARRFRAVTLARRRRQLRRYFRDAAELEAQGRRGRPVRREHGRRLVRSTGRSTATTTATGTGFLAGQVIEVAVRAPDCWSPRVDRGPGLRTGWTRSSAHR